jgi:hypothetical protein
MMKPPLDMKASAEEKNYGIDWAPQLADEAATIVTSEWVILSELGSPDLEVATHDIDGQTTIVQLTGGEPGNDYSLQNTITTSEGETLVDAIEVRVRSVEDKAGIY